MLEGGVEEHILRHNNHHMRHNFRHSSTTFQQNDNEDCRLRF
jgi:hypothetical protein